MIVEVITPSKLSDFIRSDGASVKTNLQPIYKELCEKLDEWGLPRKIHNVACYVEHETPEDKREFDRLSRMKGYDSTRPDPRQPRLTMLERKAVVAEALKTFLGTQILADQGVPEYKIEAKLLKRLVVHFERQMRGRIHSSYYRNDEYELAECAMKHLYNAQKVPWIKRDEGVWHPINSGTAFNRVSAYADTYRFAINFAICKTPEERLEQIVQFKAQIKMLLELGQQRKTPPSIIAGLKITKKAIDEALEI